jgi:hypothetical protein
MLRLLKELKRRKVFRAAVVYGVVAWAVIEAADVILPALRLPEWTTTLVVAFAFLGFPLALVLAWAFDLTPEGLERDQGEEERNPAAGTRSDTRAATGWSVSRVAGTGLLALGAATHLAADALLVKPTGHSYPVLWPLTRYHPPTPGLYLSTDPWPTIAAGLVAVAAWAVARRS